MCSPTDNVSHTASFPSLPNPPSHSSSKSLTPFYACRPKKERARKRETRVSSSRGLVPSCVHYFPLLPRRVGNSYMIYIIMYLNLPIISIYILLLYYNTPIHPYTTPYTHIHHLMYSTIIIGLFRYIIIIIYEVPTPRSCLGLRQHTSSFNLPGQNSCNMLLNLKLFPVR